MTGPGKWFLALAVLWLVCMFLTILNYPEGKLSDRAGAAIVLGAATYKTIPSPVFAERINHAVDLYHLGMVSKLIFTGGAREKHELAESIVAMNYALEKKVSSGDIFIETSSLTTHENLLNAKPILEREKIESVLVISDALHLKRAMLMAKKLNIQVIPSGTPTTLYKSLRTKLPFALRELYFYHHYLLFSG